MSMVDASACTCSGIMMCLITSKCGNRRIISCHFGEGRAGISEKVWDLWEGPGSRVRARVGFWILSIIVLGLGWGQGS